MSERLDPRFPYPLHDELTSTIFVDVNHAHDSVTVKAITGIVSFVGNQPVDCGAKRQASAQTATCGAGLKVLKLSA